MNKYLNECNSDEGKYKWINGWLNESFEEQSLTSL